MLKEGITMIDPPEIKVSGTNRFDTGPDGSLFKIPVFDPIAKSHYWVVMNSYKWDPADYGKRVSLNMSNLVSVSVPGCYYCMLQYTPSLDKSECSGVCW